MRKRRTAASSGNKEPIDSEDGGIVRGLAGPGASLDDAFSLLEKAPSTVEVTVHPHRPLRGGRFNLSPEQGSGHLDLTRIGRDVFVITGNFAYKNPRIEFVPGDGRMQFYFKLCGDLTLGVSRTERLRINRPSLLVYNQPVGVDMREWMAPRAKERFVAITFSPDYLIKNFIEPSSTTPSRLKTLAGARDGMVAYMQGPLTSTLFDLATRLVDNPYCGLVGLVYAEALTMELLCAAVHDFTAIAEAPSEEYGDRELKCLNSAREFLLKQFSPAPTIRQVSRYAGMSETPLKHGFKAVYGETIFDFSVRCRMQHALSLLRDRQMAVSRIAESVGYSHQSTFATAFRRHFGISPSAVRSNNGS